MKVKGEISERKNPRIQLHRKYRDAYEGALKRASYQPISKAKEAVIKERHFWKFVSPTLNFTVIMAVYIIIRMGMGW